MGFKVVNKYPQDSNRTFVAIRQEAPYTAFDRILYQGQTLEELASLEKNGKLGIWKWEPPKSPKESNELETEAVPR